MQSTFLGEGYKQPKFLIDKPQKENKINFFILISIFLCNSHLLPDFCTIRYIKTPYWLLSPNLKNKY